MEREGAEEMEKGLSRRRRPREEAQGGKRGGGRGQGGRGARERGIGEAGFGEMSRGGGRRGWEKGIGREQDRTGKGA